MKRLFGGLSVALLLAVSLAVWAGDPEHDTSAQESRQTVLPLSAVVLYSSGVGYFQRDGSVEGRGHLELRFRVATVSTRQLPSAADSNNASTRSLRSKRASVRIWLG
jgi:hypothetical protein